MSSPDAEQLTITCVPAAAPRGSFRAYFLVVFGHTSSIVVLPRTGMLLIGRGAEADVRVATDQASRRHARVSVIEGAVEVTDLDSHNGTRLNGQPLVGARALRSGDVLAIGDTTLVLHAAPTLGPRVLATGAALRARLTDEVERALGFERPLAVIAVEVAGTTEQRNGAAAAVEALLRPFDVLGWSDPGHLLVVAPELDGERAGELAMRMLEAAAGGAVRAGVADCPADGCDADALVGAARDAAGRAAAGEQLRAVDAGHRVSLGGRTVVIADAAMVRVYELLRRLAPSNLSVVISGETGTGKEHAAYAVHHYSPRSGGPFVTLNCAALPENLVESELFGHEKGAFTGALAMKIGLFEGAGGGTVFLDEIGELAPATQAKLLRAVETRKVTRVGGLTEHTIDIRLVAATNRDLEAEVTAGRFRRDLLFRLSQAVVVLPPLRDRPRELALLARLLLDDACRASQRSPLALSTAALHKLARHPWPGNIRELKNLLELLAATVAEELVEPWHLPDGITGERTAAPPAPKEPEDAGGAPVFQPVADELRDLERRRMSEALTATRGNRTRAADLLGMPLRTFLLRIKQYGLTEIGKPG